MVVACDLNAAAIQVRAPGIVGPLAPFMTSRVGADRPATGSAPATESQSTGKKNLCEHGSTSRNVVNGD